jgi:hypothetical protein
MGDSLAAHGEHVSRNFIDRFMEYSAHVPSPEKYLLWSGLSVVAGALERKTWIRYNNVQCYPNIFVFLIGAAGLTKKSASSGTAVDLLKSVPGITFMPNHLNQASAIQQLALANIQKHIAINGVNYANSSAFLYASEAAMTIRNKYGSMVELLTDLYDGGPNGWHTDRAWEKATMVDGRVKIFNPCLNLLACSTPEWLTKIIGENEIRGGFYSRVFFIVQHGKSEKEERWEDDPHDHLAGTRAKLVKDLCEINKLIGPMGVTPEAREAHNAFLKVNATYIEQFHDDLFISFYARKPWHILKVAQILSASRGNTMEVNLSDWEQALDLVTGIEPDMRQVFVNTKGEEEMRLIKVIWQDIRGRTDRFTLALLLGRHHKVVNRKTLTDVLSTLKDMGRIKAELVEGRVLYSVINRELI